MHLEGEKLEEFFRYIHTRMDYIDTGEDMEKRAWNVPKVGNWRFSNWFRRRRRGGESIEERDALPGTHGLTMREVKENFSNTPGFSKSLVEDLGRKLGQPSEISEPVGTVRDIQPGSPDPITEEGKNTLGFNKYTDDLNAKSPKDVSSNTPESATSSATDNNVARDIHTSEEVRPGDGTPVTEVGNTSTSAPGGVSESILEEAASRSKASLILERALRGFLYHAKNVAVNGVIPNKSIKFRSAKQRAAIPPEQRNILNKYFVGYGSYQFKDNLMNAGKAGLEHVDELLKAKGLGKIGRGLIEKLPDAIGNKLNKVAPIAGMLGLGYLTNLDGAPDELKYLNHLYWWRLFGTSLLLKGLPYAMNYGYTNSAFGSRSAKWTVDEIQSLLGNLDPDTKDKMKNTPLSLFLEFGGTPILKAIAQVVGRSAGFSGSGSLQDISGYLSKSSEMTPEARKVVSSILDNARSRNVKQDDLAKIEKLIMMEDPMNRYFRPKLQALGVSGSDIDTVVKNPYFSKDLRKEYNLSPQEWASIYDEVMGGHGLYGKATAGKLNSLNPEMAEKFTEVMEDIYPGARNLNLLTPKLEAAGVPTQAIPAFISSLSSGGWNSPKVQEILSSMGDYASENLYNSMRGALRTANPGSRYVNPNSALAQLLAERYNLSLSDIGSLLTSVQRGELGSNPVMGRLRANGVGDDVMRDLNMFTPSDTLAAEIRNAGFTQQQAAELINGVRSGHITAPMVQRILNSKRSRMRRTAYSSRD